MISCSQSGGQVSGVLGELLPIFQWDGLFSPALLSIVLLSSLLDAYPHRRDAGKPGTLRNGTERNGREPEVIDGQYGRRRGQKLAEHMEQFVFVYGLGSYVL